MILKTLNDLLPYCKAKNCKKTMAVIAAEDEHTLEAVLRAVRDGVINAVLIGNVDSIENKLTELGNQDRSGIEIVSAGTANDAAKIAISLFHEGKADYLMKGLIETKAAMKVIVARESNMRTDHIMSQISFVQNPGYHKLFALTDSALNPKPDLEMKRQILENSVSVLHGMGIENPKVAVLAAAETINPKLQESTDAAALKEMYMKGTITGCVVEGPISIDLALEKESAEIKGYDSPVAGDADLLVCPDLVSGNLMGKGMLITGAKSAGIIVGAKAPVVLCSRAATIEDKYYSVLLGAIACY
jgi:Phosphotransacetylase